MNLSSPTVRGATRPPLVLCATGLSAPSLNGVEPPGDVIAVAPALDGVVPRDDDAISSSESSPES